MTSFRAAVLALASVEILAFGAAAVSRRLTWRDGAEIALKLTVLGGAYLALSA